MNNMGRVPPQNIDAESYVIGSCMVDQDTAVEIASLLSPVMFYKESNRKIFEAILTGVRLNGYCDLVVVTDLLRKSGNLDSVGGPLAITKMSSHIVSTGNAVNLAAIVREKYLLREFIRIGYEISDLGFGENLTELVEFAEKEIFAVSSVTHKKEFEHISRPIDGMLVKIDKIINKEMDVMGVPSGFTPLDRYTSGWQDADLIILAGRPSMGKTAMALQLARNTAELGIAVGIFSLEMSNEQLATRYLSAASDLSNTQLRSGNIPSLKKLTMDSNKIASLPIYVDDTSSISIFELRSKVKKMVTRHGVRLLMVDYLQLMKGEGNNREQEVASISRGLKSIAKEMNIPIIALSQLNRRVENTGDKRPNLSDLRESGAIEQDADMVLFLFRPAYYHQQSVDIDGIQHDADKLILVDIAKHRNGALGCIPLYHNSSLTEIGSERWPEEGVPFD
jgi:replicative DNA helicase